ncbi:hypothetical protein GCM10007874_40070 [Labrys miyagiensis]|uniref:Uncharacterized protein n=1 Tax=Labrys miyagiensis TaxID=346912 RepID=A0ABQ6CLE7_9HYPH|nr:hypothetical protein [Labrys miyagiensis]GLS20990.1 hypothetical protein GCM10007874_40070 [Labrys miyagiensis]
MKREDYLRISGLFEEFDELELTLKEAQQDPEFKLIYMTQSNRPAERIVRSQVTALLVTHLREIIAAEISRVKSALKDYGAELPDDIAA